MSFNQLQIIANNTVLDTYDDWDVSLNYQIQDILDISKRTTSFSKTIIIPGTKLNNEFFENIFDLNIDISITSYNPKRSLPCQIKIGDQAIFNGNLELLQVIVNQKMVEYEIVITGILKNILYNFGDYYLADLNLSEYNHTRSISAITNSWDYQIIKNSSLFDATGLGEGYVYPYINYGASQDINTTSYVYDQYPAVYVKTIMDKLFGFAGYSYTSDFFNSDYFKKLVVPFTNDKLQDTAENISGKTTAVSVNATLAEPSTRFNGQTLQAYENGAGVTGYRQFMPVMNRDSWWQYNSSTGYYIPFDLETGSVGNIQLQDPNNSWTIGTQTKWLCQESGYYEIDFNFDFILKFIHRDGNNISHNSGSFGYTASVFKRDIQGNYTVLSYIPSINGGSITPSGGIHTSPWYDTDNPISISTFIPNVFLNAGEQIQIGFALQYPSNISWAGVGNDGKIFMTAVVSNNSGGDPNYLSIKPATNTITNPNIEMPMNQVLPSLKMKDFFISICKMFNLIVYDNPNKTNDIIIEPRDDFFFSKRKIKDWTYILDHSQDIIQIPMSELDIRGYDFRYDVDDDYYNKQYNNETQRNYGDYEIDFLNEFSNEVQEIKIDFAPTPDTDNFISTRVAPFFADLDGDNVLKPKTVKPRILFYNGLKSGTPYVLKNSPTVTGQTITQYPYVGMWDDTTSPQFDLAWGSTEKTYYPITSYPTQTLVELFYRTTLNDLQDVNAKMIKGFFHLTPAEISDFDYRDIIFIDNAYYRVNKIADYNPVRIDRLTLVELYKISDVDYQKPEEIAIPVNNVSCPTDVVAKNIKYQGWAYVSQSGQILGEECCNQIGGYWANGFCKALNTTTGWGSGVGDDPSVTVGSGVGSTKPLITTGGFLVAPIKEERPIQLIRDNTINNGIGVQSQGYGNYVAPGSKNGIILGSNNTLVPGIENTIIIGSGITPTQSNSLIVGDLLITSDGLQWNNVYIIDAGENTVMNDSKTNFIDIVDGGYNSVRNFGGDSKLRPIIDGTEPQITSNVFV
jgi:hypothetical protein